MKKYCMSKPYDPEVLEKLQKLLLEMFEDFQKVCEKYNLQYWGVFGTAIGAVRHDGFIPWDDDLDVGMFREDYEIFLKVAPKELSDKYELMSPLFDKNCTSNVTKVMRKDTVFVAEFAKNMPQKQGIFIDIFPFDMVAPNKKDAIKQTKRTTMLGRLIFLRGCAYPIIPYGGIKGAVAGTVCFLAHWCMRILHISPAFLFRKFEEESSRYNQSESKYISNFGQPTALKKKYKKENMFPITTHKFETGTMNLIANNHEALTNVYGDYMKLPDVDKRINHCPFALKFPGEDYTIKNGKVFCRQDG